MEWNLVIFVNNNCVISILINNYIMKKEKYSLKDFGLNLEVDVKERAEEFQKYIDQLDENKHRPYLSEATDGIGSKMCVKDMYTSLPKNVISFVANDYLGMSKRLETIEAGVEALRKYGTGACAAPIIGGFLDIHRQLELSIADFVGQEDAMIFSSGFGTNQGVLSALMGSRDIALVDTYIHMSVLEGLKGTTVKRIGHNDLEYLEMTLKRVQNSYITKMVIIDGVYSQDGDIALIPDILNLCRKYGAILLVDDAHGIGVYGENGRGVIEHYHLLGEIDIITGTFSKSFGTVGGFVAGSKKIIQYLKYYTNSSIFSAAPSPQVTASVLESISLIKRYPEIRKKLWNNVSYLKGKLIDSGFDIKETVSPIFPIMIRDDYKVKQVAAMLLQEGIYAVGICYPAVSKKDARIRANVLATHEYDDLDMLVATLLKIDKVLKLRN